MKPAARVLAAFAFAVTCVAGCASESDDGEAPGPSTETTQTASEGNVASHEEADDVVWNEADVVEITLAGDSISLSENAGSSATVSGSTVTINAGGVFRVTGSLSDGQLIVQSSDSKTVKLILDEASITTTSASAPIDIEEAEKVVVILAEGSVNTLTDDDTYALAEGADEPNATLYSKADLTVFGAGDGSGQLVIHARFNDGIGAKDGLVLDSARLSVDAADDGIRGKDYLIARKGTVVVDAGGDGLVSDEAEDAAKGYVQIESGSYTVVAAGDALQAQTDLIIKDGAFDLTTGGGSGVSVGADASAKALKAVVQVAVSGGSFEIDSADDAIHSDADVVLDGGSFAIRTADDAVHAETSLTVNGGSLEAAKCYEGLESALITINGGDLRVVASDDGVNVADGSSTEPFNPAGGSSSKLRLYVNGGSISVDSQGDGVDVNGSIVMTGGTLLVNGPTSSANGAIDYDGTFEISGGVVIAAGSSGMAQAPSTSSSQRSVKITYGTVSSGGPGGGPGGGSGGGGSTAALAAGTLMQLRTSAGENLLSFAPTRSYQTLVFSSPALSSGLGLSVYTGGSCTDTAADGLHEAGACSGGTLETSLTLSSVVTSASFQ